MKNESGPGVPEGLPRTIRSIVDLLGIEDVDRLWIFPPLIRGRKEWGLVVATVFTGSDDRRRLLSAAYTAERTGEGLSLSHDVNEQGDAPPDRLPRVMNGVTRRAGDDLGEPREVVVDGRPKAFEELMAEFDPALLESANSSVNP